MSSVYPRLHAKKVSLFDSPPPRPLTLPPPSLSPLSAFPGKHDIN